MDAKNAQRVLAAALFALAYFLVAPQLSASAATLSPAAPTAAASYGGSWQGNAALNWAEAHATGCWYEWAGAGPCSRGFDCSGLVMEAVGNATGIWLPHSTYSMLSSPHLHRIALSQARRGDLMFYGSGHVEINTIWYHQTFGAHNSGSRVGYIHWGYGWYPTAAYRVW